MFRLSQALAAASIVAILAVVCGPLGVCGSLGVSGPDTAARTAFEQWAQQQSTPYKDVSYQTISNDGTFAIVRITARFKQTAQADWVEMQADVECRNVGGKWQASPYYYMNFALTQAEQERIKARQGATATAQALQQMATATAESEQKLSSYYRAGIAAYEKGEWWEAAYNLRKVVELRPTYRDVGARWAEAREKVGKIGFAHPDGAFYVMYADGSNIIKVFQGDETTQYPSWSPDGSKIVYADGNSIVVMDADGANRQVLMTVDYASPICRCLIPHWSPDGTKIVAGTPGGLYIIAHTNNYAKATCTDRYQLGGSPTSSWLPDSRGILFCERYSYHWIMYDIESQNCSQFTELGDRLNDCYTTRFITWSPDGKRVAIPASSYILVMNADGSNPTRLAVSEFGSSLSWSPDGKKIVLARGGTIVVVDSSSGEAFPIAGKEISGAQYQFSSDYYDYPSWFPSK
ncbi:MAG: hypothetical protein KKA73_01460 [Chloroflexi bacterium]|nr:hypothetical protein [Chloroflexota bacterium]MBU1746331.1 hypothetical protein [Chloroflexota bacterium]